MQNGELYLQQENWLKVKLSAKLSVSVKKWDINWAWWWNYVSLMVAEWNWNGYEISELLARSIASLLYYSSFDRY